MEIVSGFTLDLLNIEVSNIYMFSFSICETSAIGSCGISIEPISWKRINIPFEDYISHFLAT